MKKKTGRILAVGLVVFGVAGMLGLCFSLSKTVEDFKIARTESTADAVLASVAKTAEASFSLPITYFDQVADPCVNPYERSEYHALVNRTFEWESCGEYSTSYEQYLTSDVLDTELLPTATDDGGEKLLNRGVKAANFARFFHVVEGQSTRVPSTLSLVYDNSTFKFESDEFYPLAWTDEVVNRDKRNHLFSLALNVPLQIASDGYEKFTIVADDDTWIYYDNKILLDLGGIHDPMVASFKINRDGEIYASVGEVKDSGTDLTVNEDSYAYSGINVKPQDNAVLRIYHVDRNSKNSVFKLYFENMILNTFKSPELAYVSTDETGYAMPLGESYTFTPNRSHALLISAIVQITLVTLLSFAVAILSPVIYRSFRKK